ncbi:MAG: acyl-CoA dehydrogenase [Alphaproteobacteria bacterium]|nr:acyl-CoA dehydrogenase [Alphaproteobacteria bacterium]
MNHSVYFSTEHQILRDQIRRFVEDEVEPNGGAWEADRRIPRDVFRRMGELGLFGVRYPETYGGTAMDSLATVAVAEELGRTTYNGVAVSAMVHSEMAAPHLARFGSDEQKAAYLPSMIGGETVTAVAVTEPGAGSDVAALRTSATRAGNDSWILNGSKTFITNGVHADLLFVAARTDAATKGSRGISMFIVRRDDPGFSVGRQLEKMGWHCSDTAELVFDDCRIPADRLLGAENQGFYAVMSNFQNERLVIGAMIVGMCDRALEITLDYVRERHAFGETLWQKQAIRQRLAMLAARVECARQLVHHTAWLDCRGQDCVKEVSMIKALCGELVNDVTYDCLQFHGGAGYMRDMAIERMYRDARVHAIGGGATEVMLEEIAKRL